MAKRTESSIHMIWLDGEPTRVAPSGRKVYGVTYPFSRSQKMGPDNHVTVKKPSKGGQATITGQFKGEKFRRIVEPAGTVVFKNGLKIAHLSKGTLPL